MKRINNLIDKIGDIRNINYADARARECKRNRYGVKRHDLNKDKENEDLSFNLRFGLYETSPYTTFTIYEPKKRLIFRLPYYPDRIAHHAIMNVLEPIWKKIFTRDTYSSISGRGIHSLLKHLVYDLHHDPEGTVYCLKLDIHKFYPSINHDILKLIIRKKLKDKILLEILDEIIDSAEGVPIGNYLSLYFANLYLAYFDHWVKEVLKVKHYYRYADDMVFLASSKEELWNVFYQVKEYIEVKLKLQLKPNWLVFPVEARGIDYVGYVVKHHSIRLRKSIKMRIWRTIHKWKQGKISREKLQRSLSSYFGWLKYCRSKNLLKKIFLETGMRDTGWNAKIVNITDYYNKWVFVTGINYRNTYYKIQFMYKHRAYEAISRNKRLFITLYNKTYPRVLKLSQCLQHKKLNPQLHQ